MRLPRDLTGAELIKRLSKLGYRQTRQTGSHIRVTCDTPKQHHVTIPLHDPLRIGTLAAILGNVVGIEILDASKRMENPSSVEYAIAS